MMRALAYCSLALSLVPLPAMAAPTEPLVLTPTIKWEINYDKEACHLFNKFGTGKDEVTLRLTRYQPSAGFDLALYGQRFQSDTPFVQTNVSFDPNPAQKSLALAATVAKKIPTLLFISLDLTGIRDPEKKTVVAPATPEQESKVTGITLKVQRKQPIFLKTGSLAAPLRAMRKCTDDLIHSWGYDPAQSERLRTSPEPISSPETWIRDFDFPINALFDGQSGDVQFRLDVQADGSVGGCHILYRTDPDQFADYTCKLLSKRAKFLPARDEAGVPVRWYFISKVRFLADPPTRLR